MAFQAQAECPDSPLPSLLLPQPCRLELPLTVLHESSTLRRVSCPVVHVAAAHDSPPSTPAPGPLHPALRAAGCSWTGPPPWRAMGAAPLHQHCPPHGDCKTGARRGPAPSSTWWWAASRCCLLGGLFQAPVLQSLHRLPAGHGFPAVTRGCQLPWQGQVPQHTPARPGALKATRCCLLGAPTRALQPPLPPPPVVCAQTQSAPCSRQANTMGQSPKFWLQLHHSEYVCQAGQWDGRA